MPRLFPRLTASRLQATTYLLGIALFSISFLVFLNSSISFVVTEVVKRKERVGDAVGTLGFADELLALVACPLWGMLSDRVGVRTVAVLGYSIVGLSLICLVQSTNIYPELLLGRLAFSIGGAACSTMVTAVLPAMVAERAGGRAELDEEHASANGNAAKRVGRSGSIGHGPSPSVSSELTITPTRYASNSESRSGHSERDTDEGDGKEKSSGTSQLAGLVGFFTGGGALLALAVFLPLPAYLQDDGFSQAESVQVSYYIVGAIAFCVAVFIFFGLRHLPGEESKSLSALFRPPYDESTVIGHDGHLRTTITPAPSYLTLASKSVKLGFTDSAIGLGYLGGLVARASSVGISLFIPLFVNAYFVRNGLCTTNPDDLTDIKQNCQRAYKLASALSGIAETAALICAPIFGWLGGRTAQSAPEKLLFIGALVGIAGYTGFGLLRNPDPFHGGSGKWALLSAILIGISQISSIVCSLGLLGLGINRSSESADGNTDSAPPVDTSEDIAHAEVGPVEGEEVAALLPSAASKKGNGPRHGRQHLKGSIAGVYSLTGGAGILILTKLGGSLFDSWTDGAPFFLMAVFNALLLVAIVLVNLSRGAAKLRHNIHND